MCAIKEVKVVSDDQTSKECLKQLNQVSFIYSFSTFLFIINLSPFKVCDKLRSVILGLSFDISPFQFCIRYLTDFISCTGNHFTQ